VRISGCGPLSGTVAAFAQSIPVRSGTAVTLTLSPGRLLPDALVGPARVLGEWAELLR
jgi:hypothetical protein